jgi:hypothetical protein
MDLFSKYGRWPGHAWLHARSVSPRSGLVTLVTIVRHSSVKAFVACPVHPMRLLEARSVVGHRRVELWARVGGAGRVTWEEQGAITARVPLHTAAAQPEIMDERERGMPPSFPSSPWLHGSTASPRDPEARRSQSIQCAACPCMYHARLRTPWYHSSSTQCTSGPSCLLLDAFDGCVGSVVYVPITRSLYTPSLILPPPSDPYYSSLI